MNFEEFKKKVKKHAAAAAVAANSIRNFDQMAANDDYVHSADLNTGKGKHNNNNGNNNKNSNNRIIKNNVATRQLSTNPDKTQNGRNAALQQATAFSMEIELGSSGSSSRNSIDFDSVDQHQDQEPTETKKRDPKRFLNDLDERLARPEIEPIRVDTTSFQQESAMSNNNNNNYNNGGKPPAIATWLNNVAQSPVVGNILSRLQSPQFASLREQDEEEKAPMLVGPLSARHLKKQETHDEEEGHAGTNIQVRTASSLLDADELAELERMRNATSHHSSIFTLFKGIRDNPEYGFIVLTLILSAVAYFYYRHKEDIDEVT